MSLHNTEKNHNSQSNKAQMTDVVAYWKNTGETLAVMLRRFREEYVLDETVKLTYAGRLDPMAEGIVPILAGNSRFQKEQFMNKPKTYEVQVLLGISTDTGDMLGLATSPLISTTTDIDEQKIQAAITLLAQTVSLPYPNYSSIPVDGKPLFMHARMHNTVVLPIKKVTIYDIAMLDIKSFPLKELLDQSMQIIKQVHGDFRQEEILEQWMKMREEHRDSIITIVTIRTTVSSGTYMRSLAEKLGKLIKIPTLAYTIKRTFIDGIQ